MKKITDALFGDLYYQDITEQDFTRISKLERSLQGRVCPEPFRKLMVLNTGDVIVCCPQWMPAVVGNVLEQDLQEIWTGEKIKIIRETMLDGSYRYCDKKVCHFITQAEHTFPLKSGFNPAIKRFPSEINLSVDSTCNLWCPSCRLEKVTLIGEKREKAAKIIGKVLDSIFYEPHNEHIDLELDGVGDIWGSAIYRNEFETRECFSKPNLWPNLKYTLLTNGVMMTEKIQRRHETLFSQTKVVKISIDAGNETSYDRVRLGGNWNMLWKNLDYLYESRLRLPGNRVEWAWIVVVQQDNYESIQELFNLASKYTDNLPRIHLHPILQGAHMHDTIFRKKAVWLETHPNYAKLQEILNSQAVQEYPLVYMPI